MGVTKLRQSLVVHGSIKVGSAGDVMLSRGAANRLDLATGDTLRLVSGPLEIGADVGVVRTAANALGLATGDSLDLLTNNTNIQLPGGTAAIGTAAMGTAMQRLRVGTNGGTACLAFELNGTVYALHTATVVAS